MLAIPHEFEVHQSTSLNSFDSIGFQSETSVEGSFSYVFTKPGTYYYSTDVQSNFPMSGTIVVNPLEDIVTELQVTVNNIFSQYNINQTCLNEEDKSLESSGMDNNCLDWEDVSSERMHTEPPVFVYSQCSTPFVHSIENGYSTLESEIRIIGDGFGSTIANVSISFSGIECDPNKVTNNVIECLLDDEATPVPFVYLPLSIHVDNYGYALVLGENEANRSISLNPMITNVHPSEGSILGGNTIIIEGQSFFQDYLQVFVGDSQCTVTSVDYTMISCVVPQALEQSDSQELVTVINSKLSRTAVAKMDNHYTYSSNHTPTVSMISPLAVMGENVTTIALTGELLDENSQVMIGMNHICENVTMIDDENIVCLLNPIPAGEYEISVLVEQYGYAQTDEVIVSNLALHSATPELGSIRGGTEITLEGYGFSPILNENVVLVGDEECVIIDSSYSTITCITPDVGVNGSADLSVSVSVSGTGSLLNKRNTDGVQAGGISFDFSFEATPMLSSISPSQGQEGDVVEILGDRFVDDIESISVTIGASECTVTAASTTSITCILGQGFVGMAKVNVVIDGLGLAFGNVEFAYILRVNGSKPAEGSFAGQNTLTISGVGFSPTASFVTICGKTCLPSTSPPSLTSLKCIVPSFAEEIADSKTCNVTVTSFSTVVTLENAYTFKESLTSYVTAINDTRGGTAGGTIISLTGSGFGMGSPQVTIDGIQCVVTESSSTNIVCITGSIGRTIVAEVRVYIEGKGYAVVSNDVYFYYVDLWSSVFTWGGTQLPVEGDFVIVGAGQTLVLDTVTPILRILLIQGGELIFDDVPTEGGIQLHTEYILITDGGKLQIGTEEQPYMNKAEIIMYGNVLSTELPLFGAKTCAVRDGTVDFHGKPIMNTWTRLSATVEPGETTIYVQDSVSDWEVDGKIVIASTSYSQRENEELTITSIGDDGKTIHLADPVQYRHIYYTQTIEGRYLETAAEVGYLTRNIKFRGNRNEEWDIEYDACEAEFDPGQFATQTCFNGRFGAETVGDQFGAQLMFHKGPNDKVIGRLEYAEFTHVGQAFRLGRYPIHFHLSGNVNDSYVRGNAIHHTFNRAVTVHAVDYLLIEKNVAYNILGHAYFLEDGIEENNIIQYNLGVYVRASSSLLNVDITPATFWVVNPYNTIRGNAAAGGSHFGFWYRLPQNPTGPSFTTSVNPINLPLQEFNGNTAHSFGWYGIWIFPSYYPGGKKTDCEKLEPAVFSNFFAWRNVRGVEFSEVGAVQLINSTMLDNELAGVEYTHVIGTWGRDSALIENVLVVGRSGLRDYDDQRVRGGGIVCSESGIKAPHSYYLTVSDVTFVNFDEENCVAVQACSHCRTQQGGYETRFEKLKFVNSPNIVTWKWEHEQVLRDLDGTLTGTEGGSLIPWMNALPTASCSNHDSTVGSIQGAYCDNTVQFNRFALVDPVPTSLTFRLLNATSMFGTVSLEFVFKRIEFGAGYMGILPNNVEYTLEWADGDRFANISYSTLFSGMTLEDHFFIRHDFPSHVDVINIDGKTTNASVGRPNPQESETGDWYSNANDTSLTYIVRGTDDCPRHFDLDVTTYVCFFENCIPPPPPEPTTPPPPGRPNVTHMWSDASIWPNGIVPSEDGIDVVINSSYYILVEENDVLPRFNRLTIVGGLEILDTVDRVIQAELIIIDENGQLVAGTVSEPYQHNLEIVLTGDLSTSVYRLPNLGPVLGAKAIGVFGLLSLHGQTRDSTWTFLNATAEAGTNEISLESPVDWKIGETIVIASTSFEAKEAEEVLISDITNSGMSITLASNLEHTHLGGMHNTDSCSVRVSAEVGLLSRNIRILGTVPGSDDDTAAKESYGCRVLVGTYLSNNGQFYTGSAQLSGVEFSGCGQEGFADSFDPRFSLVFLNTGLINNDTSYIANCSIHDGYNVGIGVYGTDNLVVKNNVIHNTVGASVDITGRSHAVIDNLAVVALFPGTYREPEEPDNDEWTANFKINEATDLTLTGNSAAGGAKSGFHTDGENCLVEGFVSKWSNNIAHSTLHGVHIGYTDGHFTSSARGCSAISNFQIHNSFFFGIFAFTPAAIRISDCTLVNNYASVFVSVIGPSSLSHEFSDKTVMISDTLIVGGIHQDGTVADCDAYSYKPEIAFHPRSHSGIQGPSGGHVGIVISTFTSGRGGFPKFPWYVAHNYPAIAGLTTLRNVTFCKFGMHCGTRRGIALMSHPKSEDCQHPVEASETKFFDVDNASKFFNHNPILGSVNPSDCVDMDCDALKKILIRDLDGSFVGSNNGLNTLTSNSAFEWDGDSRRGLGNYRIPRFMLAKLDGGKLDPNVVYPNKGIYRGSDDECKFNKDWNTYHCTGIDHMMMIIESLDADTEVRRLSPVGVGAGGYIDLINGPQDHGWCGGYTCQERISTFYSIIATGLEYTVALTSTNPQDMRMYIINGNPTQKIVVGLFYNSPQRLDIYEDSVYIPPTNGYFDNDGNLRYSRGSTDQFIPTIDNSHGTNFYDRSFKKLYFVIEGGKPISIITQPVIQLGIDLPPIEVDDFFETNLINNLALLLGISQSQIRIVNVVSESSRKRQTASVRVEVEIGAAPTNQTRNQTVTGDGNTYNTTTEPTNRDTQFEELVDTATRTAEIIQTGALSDSINVPIVSASLEPPEPEPVDPSGGLRVNEGEGGPQPGEDGTEDLTTISEQQLMEEEATQNVTESISLSIPSKLSTVNIPSQGIEGVPLADPIEIAMLDGNEEIVVNLGFNVAWRLQASIIRGPDNSFLINDTVGMMNGKGRFSNLTFSHAGTYRLQFTVVYPTNASFTLQLSSDVEIVTRELYIVIDTQPPTTANTTFDLYPYSKLSIRDRSNHNIVDNLGWRGREWFAVATVINTSTQRQHGTSIKVNIMNGIAMFSSISIDSEGTYLIRFSVETDPTSNDSEIPDSVESNDISITQLPFTRFITTYNEDYDEVVDSLFLETFVAYALQDTEDIFIYNASVIRGSIIVSFFASSSNADTLSEFSTTITMTDHLELFTYNGMILNLTSSVQDPAYPIVFPTETPEEKLEFLIVVVISVAIGSVILLSMAVLTFSLFCYFGNKKVSSSKQRALKVKPIENAYEMGTIYQNAPIFDDDDGYPAFHIVMDDSNNQMSLAKEVSRPASRASTADSMYKSDKKLVHYVSSKEIKVDDSVTVYDKAQLTQGDFEDDMSLDDLLKNQSGQYLINNNSNNNNNNNSVESLSLSYSRLMEQHPSSVSGSDITLPPTYRTPSVPPRMSPLIPQPINEEMTSEENLHGLKVTTFN